MLPESICLEQPVQPMAITVLQQPMWLSLGVSGQQRSLCCIWKCLSTAACAAPGRVCYNILAAPGRICAVLHLEVYSPLLPRDESDLQQPVQLLEVFVYGSLYMVYSSVCCTCWTCSSLCYPWATMTFSSLCSPWKFFVYVNYCYFKIIRLMCNTLNR
jgi:hypothetical protein